MLVLTFSTGIVDAVCYLGLDRVFTANMTGNVVILGMGLAGADGLSVAGPLLALAGFMGGAAVGGRLLRNSAAAWTARTTAALCFVAVVVASLAIGSATIDAFATPGRSLTFSVTALLGSAMGLQAATARSLAVPDVTTVAVTATVVHLSSDATSGGAEQGASTRRVLAIGLLLAGAAVGALLLRWHLAAGLSLAAVTCVVVATIGVIAHRRLENESMEE
ncbi:DUF1275 domain-containing protein [Aeromicrobium sp. YIM 150415]|nr:DUF1275 domain-containing protein [Aeromicrobium sp. YIM 150415]